MGKNLDKMTEVVNHQEKVNNFLEEALRDQLIDVLRKLNLPTTGRKAELKIRLIEGWKDLTLEEIVKILPENSASEQQPLDDLDLDEESDDEPATADEEAVLDEEIAKAERILLKRKKLARLRKELAELALDSASEAGRTTSSSEMTGMTEMTGVTFTNQTISFRDVEGSLLQFSGDDNFTIQRWIKHFEDSSALYKWTEFFKFVYAQRLLTGTARLFLRSSTAKNWNDFKAELLSEF